jgi:hypothetical protein
MSDRVLAVMAVPVKGHKFGRPRGKTCRWTQELDEVLRSAWLRGGLQAAKRAVRESQPTWSIYSEVLWLEAACGKRTDPTFPRS